MYNFKISEFLIVPSSHVPIHVANMIWQHHILPLQVVRNAIEQPIIISKSSGYRPLDYEISKGRMGSSQHCFGEFETSRFNPNHKGAVDLRYTPELLKELKQNSPYTRICYYPNNGFIHCDYATEDRNYYEADSPSGRWVFKERML